MTDGRTDTPRQPLLTLGLLVLAFVVLATAYNVSVPVFEGPDEPQHYFFAQHLAQTRSLPVQSLDESERGPWEQEGSQPPLYYAMVAPLLSALGSDLGADEQRYNHQNTMGFPALVGNENRYVHAPEDEAWPWHGYALAVHLGRSLATLIACFTVLSVAAITGRIVRREVTESPAQNERARATAGWLPLAAAAVVAFNPQFLAMSSTFSNDALVVALATASLALLLRIADGHDGRGTVIALALVTGLAPIAKLSGLALVGFTVLTLVAIAWRRRDARFLLRTAGTVLLAVLLFAGWWYARNLTLYGDVTGLSHMLPSSLQRDFNPDRWLRGLPAELRGLWFSSWALFGWFTVMAPGWLYGAISVASVAGVVGLVIGAVRRVAWLRWRRLAWLLLWSSLVLVSLLRWMTMAKGAHGRLMFPAIAVLAVVLVAGWRALVPDRVTDRAIAVTVATTMCGLSIYALFGVIRPAYAWPERIAAADIPASAQSAGVVFDGKLRLVAADVPESAMEGELMPVTLYWQVLEPMTRDGYVALRLDQHVTRGARPDASMNIEPDSADASLAYLGSGAAPPALLEPADDVLVDRQFIIAPGPARAFFDLDDAPSMPVEGRLSVHVYDAEQGAAWAASTTEGAATSDWSTAVLLRPATALSTSPEAAEDYAGMGSDTLWTAPLVLAGPTTLAARFENGIELHRIEYRGLDPRGGIPGPPYMWRLSGNDSNRLQQSKSHGLRWTGVTWLPTADIDVDLTAFVHLVGDDLVATFDRPPATHGSYPTADWLAGEPVTAMVPWRVPDDTPPGRYQLLVGLYDPATGERVPAYGPDGSRLPTDAIVIDRIEVGD